jgi:hypothetical protein
MGDTVTNGPLAPGWRHRFMEAPPVLYLEPRERLFLRMRVDHWQEMVGVMLSRVDEGTLAPPYTQGDLLVAARAVNRWLRAEGPRPLVVVDVAIAAVLIEAIETNPYFSRMPDNDPRLCAPAIAAAEIVRDKIAEVCGKRPGPIPLGLNRRSRPAGVSGVPRCA